MDSINYKTFIIYFFLKINFIKCLITIQDSNDASIVYQDMEVAGIAVLEEMVQGNISRLYKLPGNINIDEMRLFMKCCHKDENIDEIPENITYINLIILKDALQPNVTLKVNFYKSIFTKFIAVSNPKLDYDAIKSGDKFEQVIMMSALSSVFNTGIRIVNINKITEIHWLPTKQHMTSTKIYNETHLVLNTITFSTKDFFENAANIENKPEIQAILVQLFVDFKFDGLETRETKFSMYFDDEILLELILKCGFRCLKFGSQLSGFEFIRRAELAIASKIKEVQINGNKGTPVFKFISLNGYPYFHSVKFSNMVLIPMVLKVIPYEILNLHGNYETTSNVGMCQFGQDNVYLEFDRVALPSYLHTLFFTETSILEVLIFRHIRFVGILFTSKLCRILASKLIKLVFDDCVLNNDTSVLDLIATCRKLECLKITDSDYLNKYSEKLDLTQSKNSLKALTLDNINLNEKLFEMLSKLSVLEYLKLSIRSIRNCTPFFSNSIRTLVSLSISTNDNVILSSSLLDPISTSTVLKKLYLDINRHELTTNLPSSIKKLHLKNILFTDQHNPFISLMNL